MHRMPDCILGVDLFGRTWRLQWRVSVIGFNAYLWSNVRAAF